MNVKKIFWHFLSGGGFNPAPYLDLINLQSDLSSYFTLSGSKITQWAEVGGTLWTQGTDANRPLLTAGIPIFDGSNDTIIRDSEVSATTYSLYYVFKNTSALTKILMGAGVANDYLLAAGNYQMQMNTGGVNRCGMEAGIAVNKRYVVLSIHRTGNTVVGMVDDRVLYNRSNTFAGQTTSIQKLCTNPAGNFPMGGGVKALCMSSTNHYGTDINTQIINYLRTLYGLDSDTASMTVMGFGDSNTVGTGSTTYLVSLATSLGVSYTQLGISGTLFTSGTNNGYTRFNSQLITRPYTDYVVIQYGTNDVLTPVAAGTYGTMLNEKVAFLISSGYDPDKICLVSIPYQKSNANSALLDSYRTEISTIATNNGTKYWDLLQWMRDNGGDALFPSDNVHYNQATQDAMSAGVYAAFTS